MRRPEINDLVLWDNRFGIVTQITETGAICVGMYGRYPLNKFVVQLKEFDDGKAFTDIQTASLYEFQESIGENVYDPGGYAEGFRVLEVAKNMSGRVCENKPIYWVKLYNKELHELKSAHVYRADFNGHLYWGKD